MQDEDRAHPPSAGEQRPAREGPPPRSDERQREQRAEQAQGYGDNVNDEQRRVHADAHARRQEGGPTQRPVEVDRGKRERPGARRVRAHVPTGGHRSGANLHLIGSLGSLS